MDKRYCEQQRLFMQTAFRQAKLGYKKEEVPVGAVLVYKQQIIAAAHDCREQSEQVYAHAEMLCLHQACALLGSWRLEDADLYVTLEPCLMCSGAIIQARIRNLYYGASSPKFGAISNGDIFNQKWHTHKVEVHKGLMETESKELLQSFFRSKRR